MDYYRVILPPSALRPMQRSFTSSAFLFPHKELWSSNEVYASSADRNYTTGNIKQFFDDINYPTGWLQYQRISPALSLDPPEVEVRVGPIKTREAFLFLSLSNVTLFHRRPIATIYLSPELPDS